MKPMALWLLAGAMLAAPATPASAQLYSCRGYPPSEVLSQVKAQVEVLRRLEREAADRLSGADTRTFEWLLGQTRAAAAAIAVPALLAAEGELDRCRNLVRPLRRECANAAAALVRLIERLAANEPADEAKAAYAQAVPACERSCGLKPIDTAFRTPK
jgi:hypothetical protein